MNNMKSYLKSFDPFKLCLLVVIILFAAVGVWYLPSPAANTLVVPNRDLPAYHLIRTSDLTSIPLSEVNGARNDSAYNNEETDLLHRYTRQPLRVHQAISQSQLVPIANMKLVDTTEDPFTDTIPTAIPATAAMTFNGQLAPGAVVTLWDFEPIEPNELVNVLLLDVQKVEASVDTPTNPPYVMILAIPKSWQARIIEMAREGTLDVALVAP